jgi:hypothetical protein
MGLQLKKEHTSPTTSDTMIHNVTRWDPAFQNIPMNMLGLIGAPGFGSTLA